MCKRTERCSGGDVACDSMLPKRGAGWGSRKEVMEDEPGLSGRVLLRVALAQKFGSTS